MSALSLAVLTSGCVSVKAHLADRERVDQDLPAGAEELYPQREKTRKVLVVEVDQKAKEAAVSKKVVAEPVKPAEEKSTEGQSKVVTETKETVVVHDTNFSFPAQTSQTLTQPATPEGSGVEEYVIQKDDTLQKIAKKLYGSYSKWTVIYDANRDVVKDPNFLKPGRTLKIPLPANAPQATQTNK